ncbi:MAG TPA: hypothetical protein VG962_05510, partial [Steroidobacteraceae bacterium]|nr:hypothetical protein [Steroidobacteraceae bacterium]
NRRFLPEPIGARLFLTKHCFVKPSGHARMYALGLHVAWIAKCNVFTALLKNTDNTASKDVSVDRIRTDIQ